MLKPKLLWSVALAIGCGITLSPSGIAQTNAVQEQGNLELVMNWWREVVAFGHVELASKYMAADYVEHSATKQSGREGFLKLVSRTPAKPIQSKLPAPPAKAFAKGDYVVLVWDHADKDPKTSTAYKYFTYDVIRVKNGKIQEHWDSARPAE
jgi:predicted SnoaL-like aldol condensation-catalyzing enzyme